MFFLIKIGLTLSLLFSSYCFTSPQIRFFDNPDNLLRFPLSEYTICEIPNLGKFYIDNIKDGIKIQMRNGNGWETNIVNNVFKKYIKEGNVILDIGAHIGTHTVSFSKLVGSNGKVIAFEPQRKIFLELYYNLKLNQCENVAVYNFAIGNENKLVHLGRVVQDPHGVKNEGARFVSETPEFDSDETVLMKTIDSLDLGAVSFIKIDVENLEKKVLEGAHHTIKLYRPIIYIEIQGNLQKAFEECGTIKNAQTYMNQEKAITLKMLTNLNYTIQHIACTDYLALPL